MDLAAPPISEKEFDHIRSLAMAHAGIAIADYKRSMVYRRVSKRLRALGMATVGQYCSFLNSDAGPGEIQSLVNALTTNKTEFFRERHHFDHLTSTALPALLHRLERNGSHRLRLWSAGCSSGQEPYSLAMTLIGSVQNLQRWDARILATDIDTDILAKAHGGLFSADEIEMIPEALRRKFLVKCSGERTQFRIHETARSLISFLPLNLHESWPMRGPFDIIFCRNVVIYFDKPTQCRLFDRFADILEPDGYLYVGHSESLYKVSERFRSIGQSVYQKIA